jgi:exodeoxyribonuclease VII large subunit
LNDVPDHASEGGWPGTRTAGGPAIFTVTQVTSAIRDVLEGTFGRLRVHGEVSNLSRPQSGHLYFSLVDDASGRDRSRLTSSQLACVAWRLVASRLRFRLENGQKVVVTGRIGVYEPRGTYQLVAEAIAPAGVGELQRLFAALKERLRAEGLFDPARKRPLPFLPGRIGLITSPSGAAIQDVLRVLYLRHPRAWVRIIPVRVQGEGAAAEIAAAIQAFQVGGGQADVLILARGGGSLEDLWAFNEEQVARALAASRIPTVAAIGHETDFSIADFVADARAQTPTQAAELAVPDLSDLAARLGGIATRQGRALRNVAARKEVELRRLLRSRPFRNPEGLVAGLVERCDLASRDLDLHAASLLRGCHDSLRSLSLRLEALQPAKVLERGYAIVTDERGRILRSAAGLEAGQVLHVRLAAGAARVQVVAADPAGRPAAAGREPGSGASGSSRLNQ